MNAAPEIKVLPIGEVRLNPDNPRIIRDEKFKKLVRSLSAFPTMSLVRPLVIDENNVVLGGNMRLRAMQESGWEEVPVIQVTDWSEEKKRELLPRIISAMANGIGRCWQTNGMSWSWKSGGWMCRRLTRRPK